MKVPPIKLPDWVDERHIYIFAGCEEVARKFKGKPWQVKTARCNWCGKCCMNVKDSWKWGKNKETGHCVRLEPYGGDLWICRDRPFECAHGNPDANYCCIEWRAI
jgi:hypothetical protein